jgi:hypothetical protein
LWRALADVAGIHAGFIRWVLEISAGEISMRIIRFQMVRACLLCIGFGALASSVRADEGDPVLQTEKDWVDGRWQETQVGQFLGATIQTPRRPTYKGVAVKVGPGQEAAVCFDTTLLRYSAGWTGGFLKFYPARYGLIQPPSPEGSVRFTSEAVPGWAKDGSFADPRPLRLGPLPRDWAHYQGLYLSGERVVFSYTAGSVTVLDSPWFETEGGLAVFSRSLQFTGEPGGFAMRVLDEPEARRSQELAGAGLAVLAVGDEVLLVGVVGEGAELKAEGTGVNLHVSANARALRLLMARASREQIPLFQRHLRAAKTEALDRMIRTNTVKWPQVLETRGTVDRSKTPFAIDTVTVPHDNPWKALLFTSGHDFFENGDAAVATIHGDVWRVSGLDDGLEKVRWKRFATGLHQPLGLKMVRNEVYVMERDQITVLHDRDGDGEADFYENFNNDCISAGGGHSYTTSLEQDSQGNFYFSKCAEDTPHGGTLIKVSADGARLEVVATGFRNPNGLGMGPGDIVTVADQQGNWVPETRLDIIKPGGFYGYMPMHKRSAEPAAFDLPLTWVPRTLDNSAGGQVWIPEKHWGPLAGQMIHLSYGRCTMMMVLRDRAHPNQGAEVPLPGRFLSGVMRGRFHPRDGHLYLTGLRGWQTAAVRDGCLQRVRFTGAAVHLPVGFTVRTNGLEITFSDKLARDVAEDTGSYAATQWNYRWSSKYGSPDVSVQAPAEERRDPVQIRSVRLAADEKTIFLEIPDLQPSMQFRVEYHLEAADGTGIKSRFYSTIHSTRGPGL